MVAPDTDVLFVGPYDLSICFGYPSPSPEPHREVESMITRILDVTHRAGKKWYFLLCYLGAKTHSLDFVIQWYILHFWPASSKESRSRV